MMLVWIKLHLLLLIWGAIAAAARRLFRKTHEYVQVQRLLCLILPVAAILSFALPKIEFSNVKTNQFSHSVESEPSETSGNKAQKGKKFRDEPFRTPLQKIAMPQAAQDWPVWFFWFCFCVWGIHFTVQVRKLRGIVAASTVIRSIGGVELCVSDRKLSPFTFWRPGKLRVIVPVGVLEDYQSLLLVLRHEFSHHKLRHTYLTYLLESLNALFLLNPGFKMLQRFSHDLMEYQCDAFLQKNYSLSDYGPRLLYIAKQTHELGPRWVLAMADSSSQLKRRMQMLFQKKTKVPLSSKARALGLAGSVLVSSALLAGVDIVPSKFMGLKAAQQLVANLRIETKNASFPIDMNESVLKHLNNYIHTERGSEYVLTSKANLAGQENFLKSTLTNSNIPTELIAIPFVEAGFASVHPPRGSNRSAGLWQFIPETARRFGLKVGPRIDERYHSQKSTDAAIAYLKTLYEIPEFHQDWRLVVLAYNAGESAVIQNMRERKTRNPWELDGVGDPAYLARVVAAMIILRSPELTSVTNPVREIRVSSPYGPRPAVFPGGRGHFHTGIDLAAEVGTPVVSPKAGVVIKRFENASLGKTLVIKHSDRIATQYSKLSEFSVEEGDKVLEGEKIGYVGNTGKSTGPHLHFEFQINSKAVDPRIFLFRYEIL